VKIAVLFSQGAGKKSLYGQIGDSLSRKLSGHKIYTYSSDFGQSYIEKAEILSGEMPRDYKLMMRKLTHALAEVEPDLFITVGGDGLAAYVADALITGGYCVPVMGIAGGTANVGPIVSINPEDLDGLDFQNLTFKKIGAIEVLEESNHISYGFNDVVISNTFLGTDDGKMVSLSVREMVEKGEKKIDQPSRNITTMEFSIRKDERILDHCIKRPAQIVISPLEVDKFYGRAVTGALCMSAFSEYKAAVALLNETVIDTGGGNKGIDSFIGVEHILFSKDETVSISGLSDDGQIVIDGNPYLRSNETVTFKYRPDLIKIVTPK